MLYVDVDKLITYFQGEWNWHDCECVRQFAEDGEFEPVVHAKWEINCDGYYPYCSNCKTEPKNGVMTKRCPECGAHMDEV